MKKTLLSALLFFVFLQVQAQDGTLDPTFGTNVSVVIAGVYNLKAFRSGLKFLAANKTRDLSRTGYASTGTMDNGFDTNSIVVPAISCTPPTFKNDGTIVLDASCGNNDGNISIIPISGTEPFMYSIDGGVTYVAGTNAGYTFGNLAAGTYQLRLKDANGCESEIVERTVRSYYGGPAFLNNNQIVLDASCGNSDGNITIQPTCGVPPFMYSINGGETYVSGPDEGYTFPNLAAGTYKLRLKDAAGRESGIVERTVRSYYGGPTFKDDGTIVLDASCGSSDGNISIIPTSGTAPFMYSINGGQTYVSSPNAGYTFGNLSAGTYQLRLKDAKGCESTIVERTVQTRYALAVPSIFTRSATCCSQGEIIIGATIPTPGYEFSIDSGKTYTPNPVFITQCGQFYVGVKYNECVSAIQPVTVGNIIVHSCLPLTTPQESAVPASATKETMIALPTSVTKETITAFPNPNNGQFKVMLQNLTSPKAEVSVFDVKGTLVQKRSLNSTKTIIADFDLKGKAPGLYLIKVVTNSGIRNMKVIVE